MYYQFAEDLASRYLKDPTLDLTAELCKVASQNNLNAQAIERVTTRTNRNILVGLQKTAVQSSTNQHFTFPTAKTSDVIHGLKRNRALDQAGHGKTKPKAPDRPRLDLSRVFGDTSKVSNNPNLNSRGAEVARENIGEAEPATDFQLKAHEEKEERSKVAALRFKIEEMEREFTKKASSEILSGRVPIDVFCALPVQDIVAPLIEKLSKLDTLHKMARLSPDAMEAGFDLDEGHPVVRLSYQIANLRGHLKNAEEALSLAETQKTEARRRFRASIK